MSTQPVAAPPTGGDPGSSAAGAAPDAGTAPATAGEQAKQEEKKFTQSDMNRAIQERLAEEKRRAERAAEEKRLAEAGEYSKLLEQERARAAELESQLKQRERALLADRIGRRHNLPEPLIDRLRGETESELEADAKELAKLLPAPAEPPRPAASPANPARPAGSHPPLIGPDGKLHIPSWGDIFKP